MKVSKAGKQLITAAIQDHAIQAVIDVGTNSVKILVAETDGKSVKPIWEQSKQTRLGEGFYATHQLQPEPIARTVKAIQSFVDTAREYGASHVRIIGTSAARDALNRQDLISAVETSIGIPMEVISGDLEAEWAFRGVISNPTLATLPLLVMDLGGGSTEFIAGSNGHAHFSQSFPLGCVRLLEQTRLPSHPSEKDFLLALEKISSYIRQHIEHSLKPALEKEKGTSILVGTGGTATLLARMEYRMEDFDRDIIEHQQLNRPKVKEWTERLWRLSHEERTHIPGLPANRADVILFGTAIYFAVMEVFHIEELRISTRGLRFGALMQPVG